MENIKPKKQKEKSFKGKGIFLALLVLVGIFVSLIEFITDFLWFKELGYTSVFFTKLLTQLKMGVPVFLMVTLLSYVYFKYRSDTRGASGDGGDEDVSDDVAEGDAHAAYFCRCAIEQSINSSSGFKVIYFGSQVR